MKIALVCTNLGDAWRGLERFTLELFNVVKEDLPITLFGCRLNGRPNEVSLPCLKDDALLSIFKGRKRDNDYFQQLSYALSFIPFVAWQRYDVVHYSQMDLGIFLWHAKQRFKLKYKILFTNWGLEDRSCFRPDYLQEITPSGYQRTIDLGVDPRKVTLLPFGVHSKNFLMTTDRNLLREKYGIPREKIVILSVAALNRRHKRIDYLIREVSRLGNDYFLLVVGRPEEPDLKILGHQRLGENFKSIYVEPGEIPGVYHLADLFVIPSLIEGFCLALVEAMCAGLPVIAHNAPVFQWVVGEPCCLVDLRKEGNLARKMEEIFKNYDTFKKIARSNQTRSSERFDWNRLKPEYLRLYEKVLG